MPNFTTPVFEGEKWCRLDSNYECVIEWPLRAMLILERETSAQIGGGANMGIVRNGHFWQLGSIAQLAAETTGGEILVAIWPKHGLRSDLRVPNFKKNVLGEHAPRPPTLFTLKCTQRPNGRTNLK